MDKRAGGARTAYTKEMKKKSKGGKSKLESIALVFGGIAIAAVVVVSSGNIGSGSAETQPASIGSVLSIFNPATWNSKEWQTPPRPQTKPSEWQVPPKPPKPAPKPKG